MYISSHPLDRYAFEMENFTTCPLGEISERVGAAEIEKKTHKESIGGIVTDVKTMTTKSGSPGAKVMLEDYSGTYEIALFGKDYETYLPFMNVHESLFIEGEIAEKYFIKPDERAKGKTAPYGFKIKKMSLLGNLTASHLAKFAIYISTDLLSDSFRKDLTKLLKTHKGDIPLNMYLQDKATGYNLEFYSKKYQVAVTQDLLVDLQRLGLPYSVVKK